MAQKPMLRAKVRVRVRLSGGCTRRSLPEMQLELELELIHTQMAQKPILRAEVYARANGGGFAGSEVLVTPQRLGGTRVVFLLARTPTHSPPDVKTRRSTPRSLYTLLYLCMSLVCLLRVWLFAMGRVLTLLDLTQGERPGSTHKH